MSKSDGSFCIPGILAGSYLLTVEKEDYDHNSRWMGFYPATKERAKGQQIQVKAGQTISELKIAGFRETLFTVSFRIVTPEGKPAPTKNLGVSIDSVFRDALSYHLTQNRVNEDGWYTVGYVPAGRYIVRTYLNPDFDSSGQMRMPENFPWAMAEQEVEIMGNTEANLKLRPLK